MSAGIQEAQRYLRDNAELREALGVSAQAALVAEPLGRGEHNDNYLFADPATQARYVLRVNHVSQLGLANQIEYEFNALKLLEPSGCTPRALYVDDTRALMDHGVLVMEFVEGEHLDFGQPAHLKQAARLLADIHALVPPPDCGLLKPSDPLKEQFAECERLFAAYCSSDLAEKRVTDKVRGFFAATAAMLAVPFDPADCAHVLNTEAVSDHFLIPHDGARGHVVDWEKPIIGEVAQDVAYFLAPTTTIWETDFIATPAQRAQFVDDYWEAVAGRFPRGSFDARYQAYLMSNNLRGITWSCNAWVEYHDPARPLRNAKTFEKLKVYLSDGFLDMLARDVFRISL